MKLIRYRISIFFLILLYAVLSAIGIKQFMNQNFELFGLYVVLTIALTLFSVKIFERWTDLEFITKHEKYKRIYNEKRSIRDKGMGST